MTDLSMMVCSGCGKKISIVGKVCPHCQRDKTQDAERHIRTMLFMLIAGAAGGIVGFLIGGSSIKGVMGVFVGAVIGMIIGAIVADATMSAPTESAPPEFRLAKEESSARERDLIGLRSLEDRLAQLELLRKKGLVSEAEYKNKRDDLIRDI